MKHFKALCCFCLLAGSLVWGTTVLAQETLLESGPMVGYSTMKEVGLWAQTTAPARVQVCYWPSGSPKDTAWTNAVQTTQAYGYVAKLKAAPLAPGQTYEYQLYINGALKSRPYALQFKAQPLWQWRTDAPDFSFLLGSCMYINETEVDRPGKPYGGQYEILTSMAKEQADMMLWLGDNTYLREVDWDSRTGIWHRFTHSRAVAELQPLLGNVHHYAILDDHDFGPNNSDASFGNKHLTQEAFKWFWSNPNYGVSGQEGVEGTFEWHDVQFFLIDNRSYRSAPSTDGHIIGQRQMQWLIQALKYSRAPFKIIAIGGQVLNPNAVGEHHSVFANERQQLLNLLHEHRIEGVIFINGDVHHSEISKLERPQAYTLYDLTTSPLTSGFHKPRNLEANYLRVPGSLQAQRNYGLVQVSGPRNNRQLTLTYKDVNGKALWSTTIEANALKYSVKK